MVLACIVRDYVVIVKMPKEVRKRQKTAKKGSKEPSKALVKAVQRAVAMDIDPGYTRTGGFYGRFGPGGELKFFDTALSFNIDATGEVPATGQLCLIPQGVTESTRVGRKCTLKSIEMKFDTLLVPAAAANSATVSAIYVVLDKQTNGAAAAATDVFTGTVMPNALRNLANSQRFVILKKFVWAQNSAAGVTTAYNNTVRHFEFYKKLNIPLEFSSTTGAITELKSNNIFLLAGSNPLDDLVQVSGNVRLRFSDN